MWAKVGGWIVAAFGASAGGLIFKALAALGIGYASYTFLVPEFKAGIASQFAGIPSEVRLALGLMKIDIFITMVLSAISVRLASRLIWRKT